MGVDPFQQFGQPVSPAFQRPQDRLRTRRETTLQHGQREADAVAAPAIGLHDPVRSVHAIAHVFRDRLVQRLLPLGKLVRDGLRATFREQRLAVEGEQVLLDHAAHESRSVGAAVPFRLVTSRETVRVEQRHEQLEVVLLAGMRGRCHQQVVLGRPREYLPEAESFGVVRLAVHVLVVGAHAVRLVHDCDVPRHLGQHRPIFVASRRLVHTHDEPVVLTERVARPAQVQHRRLEHLEVQVELVGQLIPPLLSQPSGAHDDHALGRGTQQHLLDVQACHDGLARTRIVGEEKPQRHLGQHVLVHGADLVRQWIDVGRIDGRHRIIQGRVFDAQRLSRQTKLVRIRVEFRPHALLGDDSQGPDGLLVEDLSSSAAIRACVEQVDGTTHRNRSDHFHGIIRNNAGNQQSGSDVIQ